MRTILFLVIVAYAGSCKSKPPMTNDNCQVQGTIVDFDGLDGCGYLIRLKDGKLLNPIEFPEGFHAKNKQAVRLGYTVLHDMSSICMTESEIVEINCIEDVKTTGPTDCSEISNPFAVAWMNKAINKHNPIKIIKYQIGGKWAFAFEAVPDTYLYDCEGKLLCQTNGTQDDECHRQYLDFISKGKTIWKGEGVWD